MLNTFIIARWIAILIIPLFFSCSTHYLATIQGMNMEKKEKDSTLFSSNDTLGISYAFNNIDGSVRIRFENYTEESMIIDLSKSALIVNGKSYSFIDGKSYVQGQIGAQATTMDWSNNGSFQHSTIRGVYQGTIYKDENVIFIPAKSYAEGSYLQLHSDVLQLFKNDFVGTRGQLLLDYDYVKALVAEYDENNSPLKIRSHVSYSLLDTENKPVHHEINAQNFYTTNLTKIQGAESKRIRKILESRADIIGFSEIK